MGWVRKLIRKFLFLGYLAILCTAGLGAYWWLVPVRSPVGQVDIPKGAGLRQIARLLDESGVIRFPEAFLVYVHLTGRQEQIRFGTYSFRKALTPAEVLDILVKGVIDLTTFQHPPGWNMYQVAAALQETFPKIPKEQWLEAFQDPKYVSRVSPEATSLEGYLFPDVYRIRPNATVPEVIDTMLKNFSTNFSEDLVEAGKAQGLTAHQIVVLASIVEKETGVAEERPRIAAVFLNRLRLGMLLQTDPTVIYGIWKRFDGNLRKQDLLDQKNVYNTYAIAGLPPGPIANPGLDALRAVVQPAKDKSLYFVSRGDGTHHFSRTLDEHNRAVRQFQLRHRR